MNKTIKEVNIHEYMPVLMELVNQGKTVPLLISGNSMFPFLIHHRDTIFISKPENKFKKGDIVFFRRKNGNYVVHRIHHINRAGQLFIVGDGEAIIEGPVEQTQVFGIVKKVKRKGKIIENNTFFWKIFSVFWIRVVKIRQILLNVYSLF